MSVASSRLVGPAPLCANRGIDAPLRCIQGGPIRALALALLALAPSCAGVAGWRGSPELESAHISTVTVDGGMARGPRAADAPRVLVIVAHPDDEFAFAGALFKTATHLAGTCEVVTITDGQGGFKYATLAEAFYGVPYTDEAVGRRELPRLRRREQLESARLLGLTRLHYLDQRDHRYTTDLAEVVGEDADVWELDRVALALDTLLAVGGFDFVLVHSPTAETHAHHQAATLLALAAVARQPAATRPAVLCVEVAEGADGSPPEPAPAVLAVDPGARCSGGPFVFDRTQPFGYRERLDYGLLIAAAIGRHVSQGTMLRIAGRGTHEEYWLLGTPTAAQTERVARWFERLAEPQFPGREYEASAGTNTGAGVPQR